MALRARSHAREAVITAVVKRADGSVEELGVVAYYHRNPVLRWWRNRDVSRRGKERNKS